MKVGFCIFLDRSLNSFFSFQTLQFVTHVSMDIGLQFLHVSFMRFIFSVKLACSAVPLIMFA